MHFRQKLTFMALGSILTIAGYLLATLTSDVTAQPETDKSEPLIVNEIVCRKLRVVNENDKTRVAIGEAYGGFMNVYSHEDKSVLEIATLLGGGWMNVKDKSGRRALLIDSIGGNGGSVSVWDKGRLFGSFYANSYGAGLDIYSNKKTISNTLPIGNPRIVLRASDRGNGFINIWDKDRWRTFP